jgi:hypothetical protein
MKFGIMDAALVLSYAPAIAEIFLVESAFDDIPKLLTKIQMMVDVHTRTEIPLRARTAIERLVSLFGGAKSPELFKSNVVAVTRILRLILYRLAQKTDGKLDLMSFTGGMLLELMSPRNNWIEFVTKQINETSKL